MLETANYPNPAIQIHKKLLLGQITVFNHIVTKYDLNKVVIETSMKAVLPSPVTHPSSPTYYVTPDLQSRITHNTKDIASFVLISITTILKIHGTFFHGKLNKNCLYIFLKSDLLQLVKIIVTWTSISSILMFISYLIQYILAYFLNLFNHLKSNISNAYSISIRSKADSNLHLMIKNGSPKPSFILC